MTPIGLIWAQADGGVIGHGGAMPWHIPEDLAHFKQLTLGNPVVMGRKTWDSLTPRFRPLPGRRNIVVTRQPDWRADGADATHSLSEALTEAAHGDPSRTWVIGGAELFRAAIGAADLLEVTEVRGRFDGDTFAPAIDASWVVSGHSDWLTSRTGIEYRFLRYERASDVPATAATP